HEGRLTHVGDLDLAQHLPDDDLDVLVVDLHTLQAVHLLDLVDDIFRQGINTLQTEDIVRVVRTIGDDLAAFHLLALVDTQLAPLGDQLLVGIAAIVGGNDQAPLALGFLAEGHRAADLREDGGILGLAGLEQVGNPGQTTGDVAGLGTFLRDTGDDVAGANLLAIGEGDDGVRGQHVVGRHRGVLEEQLLAVFIPQGDHRLHVLAGGGALVGVEHRDVGKARQLIGLTLDAEAFLHAGERHGTRHFGNDRVSVGIPLGHHLAGGDGIAILDGDDGAIGNLVALALTAIGIGHRQLAGAGHGHLVGLPLHQLDVEQAGSTAGFDLNVVHRGRPRCRATDVEGAHGQLGAGLADGLGGNHADRLPDVDLVAPGQVAAITLGTDAVAGLTGDGGAHTHFIDAHGLDALHPFLVDHGAGGHGDLVAAGLEHILGHHPAEDTVTQGFDDVATLDHRGHQQALGGAAVDAGDHHVLGHIHQAAGEVTGVGGLERGIRQALTGTVGGDEVLEYVQAFAEVGDDGGFDDGA